MVAGTLVSVTMPSSFPSLPCDSCNSLFLTTIRRDRLSSLPDRPAISAKCTWRRTVIKRASWGCMPERMKTNARTSAEGARLLLLSHSSAEADDLEANLLGPCSLRPILNAGGKGLFAPLTFVWSAPLQRISHDRIFQVILQRHPMTTLMMVSLGMPTACCHSIQG